MRKLHALVAVVVLISGPVVAGPSTKNRIYTVEVDKPAAPGEAEVLDIVFYVAATPAKAEKMLRIEMQSVMDNQKPAPTAFVGSAWNGIGKADGDEDEIILPDGSTSLMVDVDTHGKIVTSNEHRKSVK